MCIRDRTNICHVPEALMHYMDNQSRSVLIGERIFDETELACRLEVELEKSDVYKRQPQQYHQPSVQACNGIHSSE